MEESIAMLLEYGQHQPLRPPRRNLPREKVSQSSRSVEKMRHSSKPSRNDAIVYVFGTISVLFSSFSIQLVNSVVNVSLYFISEPAKIRFRKERLKRVCETYIFVFYIPSLHFLSRFPQIRMRFISVHSTF